MFRQLYFEDNRNIPKFKTCKYYKKLLRNKLPQSTKNNYKLIKMAAKKHYKNYKKKTNKNYKKMS